MKSETFFKLRDVWRIHANTGNTNALFLYLLLTKTNDNLTKCFTPATNKNKIYCNGISTIRLYYLMQDAEYEFTKAVDGRGNNTALISMAKILANDGEIFVPDIKKLFQDFRNKLLKIGHGL